MGRVRGPARAFGAAGAPATAPPSRPMRGARNVGCRGGVFTPMLCRTKRLFQPEGDLFAWGEGVVNDLQV